MGGGKGLGVVSFAHKSTYESSEYAKNSVSQQPYGDGDASQPLGVASECMIILSALQIEVSAV